MTQTLENGPPLGADDRNGGHDGGLGACCDRCSIGGHGGSERTPLTPV